MIPGTIYSQDGKLMPFQIEKAARSGRVTASDPQTQESFTGSYVGVFDRASGVITTFNGQTPQFSVAQTRSKTATANAFLKGDKGTMLTCVMQIEAGLQPHGIGECNDNRGKKYKLQF